MCVGIACAPTLNGWERLPRSYAVSLELNRGGRFSKKAATASWASAERTLSLNSIISAWVSTSFLRKYLFIAITYLGTAGHAFARRQTCLPSCLRSRQHEQKLSPPFSALRSVPYQLPLSPHR